MSNHRPRVSIGLPVYNGGRFLAEALDSHLAQTYADFELIISDNASTDQTEAICRAYAAKDGRIRYYRNEQNLGMGPNFNRVFQLSCSEYFKWVTADDLCEPNYLARCVELLDADPTVVLTYAKAKFIDETGKSLDAIEDPGWNLQSEAAHERMCSVLYSGHWVNCHYGLIRAHALSKTRLMPSYPEGDYRLLGELSLTGKFFEIPEYLFVRRLHPGASSQNSGRVGWLVDFFKVPSWRACLPYWNLHADHFASIVRSELSMGQKLSLAGSLLCCIGRRRRRLLKELEVAVRVHINQARSKRFRSTGPTQENSSP